jgi:ribosomal protein S12 methylthiotransferase accessory factor
LGKEMNMEIFVTLPGGKRVDAEVDGFTIHTDQGRDHGGEGSAPEPFALFLASLATCAGVYVIAFCQTRGIPTAGIRIAQRTEHEPETGRLAHVSIEVQVPPEFPEKYREGVARAAATCKVKKTLTDPPRFEVTTKVAEVSVDRAA